MNTSPLNELNHEPDDSHSLQATPSYMNHDHLQSVSVFFHLRAICWVHRADRRPKRNTIEIEEGHVRSCQSVRWLQATDAQLPYLHNYGDAVGSEWSCKSTAVVVQLRRSSAEEQAEYLCGISWYFNCIVLLITVKCSGDPFHRLDYHLHQGLRAI